MKNAIKDYSIYVEGYKHVDEKASIYTAVMRVWVLFYAPCSLFAYRGAFDAFF